VELLKRGIVVVTTVQKEFETLLRFLLKSQGYGEAPVVVLPKQFSRLPDEDCSRLADEMMDQIAAKLTRGA
jgi:hypothetical protein